jgi:hypothetical protein
MLIIRIKFVLHVHSQDLSACLSSIAIRDQIHEYPKQEYRFEWLSNNSFLHLPPAEDPASLRGQLVSASLRSHHNFQTFQVGMAMRPVHSFTLESHASISLSKPSC